MALRFSCLSALSWWQCQPVVKVVLWSRGGGAHLTKPGWSKPHTHSNPTNLTLFRHKITLYRFNQGGSYYCRGLKWEQGGLSPPSPLTLTTEIVSKLFSPGLPIDRSSQVWFQPTQGRDRQYCVEPWLTAPPACRYLVNARSVFLMRDLINCFKWSLLCAPCLSHIPFFDAFSVSFSVL